MSDLQSKSSDLSKCPGCGGPSDNGHDRCIPPNPYYCTKCEADPWENDDTEYVRAPNPGTNAPKTVVCEYRLQFPHEEHPRTYRELVPENNLVVFTNYMREIWQYHVGEPKLVNESFRVLFADNWEDEI